MELKAKPTLATLKSFVRKNKGNLHIRVNTAFNGMIDGCECFKGAQFSPITETSLHTENTLGIEGCWIVRHSRDYISPITTNEFQGYEVTNCCGRFTIAVKED